MKFLKRELVPNDLIKDDLGDMRTYQDEISDEELIEDIKKKGVHDPVLLRPHPNYAGMYQLVDGRRRFRCNKNAGNNTIPADIWEMSDIEADETALSRNIQRDNPDPIGLGFWLSRIMEKDPKIMFQKDLAERVNKSPFWVGRMLNAYNEAKKNRDNNPDLAQLLLSAPSERHVRAINEAPKKVKEKLIDLNKLGLLPSAREIERMSKAESTPQEILEVYDPIHTRFDNAFLAHTVSTKAGVTITEAREIVEQWRNFKLPWQALRKTKINATIKPNDPMAQMYTKLADIYPTELIDLVEQVVKAKSFPTMQKYCRRAILLLMNQASEELKQTVLDEFRGI